MKTTFNADHYGHKPNQIVVNEEPGLYDHDADTEEEFVTTGSIINDGLINDPNIVDFFLMKSIDKVSSQVNQDQIIKAKIKKVERTENEAFGRWWK